MSGTTVAVSTAGNGSENGTNSRVHVTENQNRGAFHSHQINFDNELNQNRGAFHSHQINWSEIDDTYLVEYLCTYYTKGN